jgi:hypothetical protein
MCFPTCLFIEPSPPVVPFVLTFAGFWPEPVTEPVTANIKPGSRTCQEEISDDWDVKVLVTGAGGVIGTMLREGLRDNLAPEMRLFDLNPITPLAGEEFVLGDVTELAQVRQAISGCDACVHLAAIPVEAAFDKILHANIQGTWAVFEAARLEGCRRVVFASSNHATGFYLVRDRVGPTDPPRPDSYYGARRSAVSTTTSTECRWPASGSVPPSPAPSMSATSPPGSRRVT